MGRLLAALLLLTAPAAAHAEWRAAVRAVAGFPEGFGPAVAIRPGIPLEFEASAGVMPMRESIVYSVRAGWAFALVDANFGGRWTVDLQPAAGLFVIERAAYVTSVPYPAAVATLAFWPLQAFGVELQAVGGATVDPDDPTLVPVMRGSLGLTF